MGRDVHGMGRQKVKKHDRKSQIYTYRKTGLSEERPV
jgi:hypothetical protein